MERRRFLVAGSLAVVGCSGCLDGVPGGDSTDGPAAGNDTGTSGPSTGEGDGENQVRMAVSGDGGERTLVTGTDVATVGEIERSRQSGYRVSVSLTEDGTEEFLDGLERAGAFDDPQAHEIRTYLDEERVSTAALTRGLATEMEDGEWDGRFIVRVEDREEAEQLRAALAGE